MRWRLLLAVIGLSIADVASFAQRPPDDQRLFSARSPLDDAGFFDAGGVVRFQLVQGRLCLDAPRHRKGSQSRDENGVYESITVTAERGIPSVHYVCQSPDQHLTLSVQDAEHVRIESWFPKSGGRAVLLQPAEGPIQWTLQRGDLQDQRQAMTLLHLHAADPTAVDDHFGLLFEYLLQGQSLAAIRAATTTAMLDELTRQPQPDAAQVHQWVDDLRSPRRGTRMQAERQLLACGTPIVPTLRAISPAKLDPEQRARIERILLQLRPAINDRPATLAKLLVNDPAYWANIAGQLDPPRQQLVRTHMQRLGLDADQIFHPVAHIATRP